MSYLRRELDQMQSFRKKYNELGQLIQNQAAQINEMINSVAAELESLTKSIKENMKKMEDQKPFRI